MSRWVAVITVVLMGLAGNALALDGAGTQEDPWLVQSLTDFDEFAGDPNYWDDYTRLETDVNLAGRVYDTAVIAPYVTDANHHFAGTAFTGAFDGNGFRIMNLTIDSSDVYIGLFGYVDDPNAEIESLGLIDPNITGSTIVGSLVGFFVGAGPITNCYAEGGSVIAETGSAGGLVSSSGGNITNCHSTLTVKGVGIVGGLVGFGGTIKDSYATGDIISSSRSSDWDGVGGLAGTFFAYSGGTITGSYATGNVTGLANVGGLVGMSGAPFPLPEVRGPTAITNCYATGNVVAEGVAGGLVGTNHDEDIEVAISNCYATGSVTGGEIESISLGGLCGSNSGTITNSYWDIEISGEPDMCGHQDPNASGCDPNHGKITAEMQRQSTFTDWDFINVWAIGEGQTYPYLRTVPAGDINKDRIVNFLDLCVIADQWAMGD